MNSYYTAHWGTTLIVMSTIFTVMLVGMPLFSIFGLPLEAIAAKLIMISVPLTILISCLLFTIRGYSFNSSTLYVHRLFWKTELSLSGIKNIEVLPNAMQKSIRTMGNGGLYSFSGQFRNKLLGNYRAFATDAKRTVVLHFVDKKFVVSPKEPEKFAGELGKLTLN